MARTRAHRLVRLSRGITVLELMIVLAIIGGGFVLVRSGFRMITRADLVEDSTELAAVMRRASQLAIEHGELHRVVLDLEKGIYVVEQCQGATAIQRNEALRPSDQDTKDALEKGKERLKGVPTSSLSPDPEAATKRALALAGHHIADRMCAPATEGLSGDATGKQWLRTLRGDKGIKFKEVWVQHRDDSATKGQVAIYFFPMGSAEKAVIEVTDGGETFSVLVFGLTGRIQLVDGVLADVDQHMLRNVMGDKDAKREDTQ